jgi:hypothetical protein
MKKLRCCRKPCELDSDPGSFFCTEHREEFRQLLPIIYAMKVNGRADFNELVEMAEEIARVENMVVAPLPVIRNRKQWN